MLVVCAGDVVAELLTAILSKERRPEPIIGDAVSKKPSIEELNSPPNFSMVIKFSDRIGTAEFFGAHSTRRSDASVTISCQCLLPVHACMLLCTGDHRFCRAGSSSRDTKTPQGPEASWLRNAFCILLAVVLLSVLIAGWPRRNNAPRRRRARRNSTVKAANWWARSLLHRAAAFKSLCSVLAFSLLTSHVAAAFALASTAPTEGRPPTAPSSPDSLSASVATSIPPGMATTQPFSDDGTALVLYRSRQLSEVTTVSTVAELIAAVSDGTVDKIVVAPGTYEFGSDMAGCGSYPAALCINRAVTIEAEVEGGVVLDGMDARRVIMVDSGGTADLVGLNITRGYASGVSSLFEPC